ncbi:DUF1361 domain-containing protein [Aureisphaera sp.]
MKKIKQFFITRFELLFPILAFSSISLFVLMLRLKFTLSFFYLFLVWNLFLAWIPFMISTYLSHKNPNRTAVILGSGIWLVFLPNAPYILTDFLHLNHPNSHPIFDGFMLAIFTIAGMICYVYSLRDMELLWRSHFSKRMIRLVLVLLPFLTGFGIYLGRFLRWNSWDIIQNPRGLMNDIFNIIIYPFDHLLAWVTTLAFGLGLLILYGFFKKTFSPLKN